MPLEKLPPMAVKLATASYPTESVVIEYLSNSTRSEYRKRSIALTFGLVGSETVLGFHLRRSMFLSARPQRKISKPDSKACMLEAKETHSGTLGEEIPL
jgi:hypothetical protein